MPAEFAGNSSLGALGLGLQHRIECRVDLQPAAMQQRVPLLIGIAEDVAPIQQVVPQRLGEVGALGRPFGATTNALGQHERFLDGDSLLLGQ